MAYSYYNQSHLFPQNPYPHPPPPPIAHKVWILDCKSCGTFLTNRAMKVFPLSSSLTHTFTHPPFLGRSSP